MTDVCSCGKRKPTLVNRIFNILVIVILTIIVICVLAFAGKIIVTNMLAYRFSRIVWDQCLESTNSYRYPISYPTSPEPKFNYHLATSLWDAGGAVSNGHCQPDIPIPKPMTHSVMINGRVVKNLDGKDTVVNAGYIYWNPDLEWACIIFAGTCYPEQWKNNMRTAQKPLKFLQEMAVPDGMAQSLPSKYVKKPFCRKKMPKYTAEPGSKHPSGIHSGFYDDYMDIRKQILDWVGGQGKKIRKFIVSGRSLGGAISTLCAYDLSYIHRLSIVHYSFASPRVGNSAFCQRFNYMVPFSIRVHNTSDYVCDLPLTIFGREMYQHTGTPRTSYVFTLNTGSLVDNHIDAYRHLTF